MNGALEAANYGKQSKVHQTTWISHHDQSGLTSHTSKSSLIFCIQGAFFFHIAKFLHYFSTDTILFFHLLKDIALFKTIKKLGWFRILILSWVWLSVFEAISNLQVVVIRFTSVNISQKYLAVFFTLYRDVMCILYFGPLIRLILIFKFSVPLVYISFIFVLAFVYLIYRL